MTTSYKITIERITTETYTGSEYQIVSDTGEGESRKREREYVTAEQVRETETVLLEQTVEKLDLVAVIKAINGL